MQLFLVNEKGIKTNCNETVCSFSGFMHSNYNFYIRFTQEIHMHGNREVHYGFKTTVHCRQFSSATKRMR